MAGALKKGFEYAIINNFDYCIQLDGDGQHIPDQINQFLPYLEENYSLIIGSRYLKNFTVDAGFLRRLGNLFISLQLLIMFRVWMSDPLSGMRMLNRKFMEDSIEYLTCFSQDAILLPFALKDKFKIIEVPVVMRARNYGNSYVSGFKGLLFLLKLIRSIYLIRFDKHKSRL